MFISYHITSYHIISYCTVSYRMSSYRIVSYRIAVQISYHHIVSYRVISYLIIYHISYIYIHSVLQCHLSYVISYHKSYIIIKTYRACSFIGDTWRNTCRSWASRFQVFMQINMLLPEVPFNTARQWQFTRISSWAGNRATSDPVTASQKTTRPASSRLSVKN